MSNSSQVFERLLQFVIRILTKKGTYTSQYSCKHVGIRVNSCRARICASHEHDFGLSLSSFDSTWVKEFENCLDDDPRVRTPIC